MKLRQENKSIVLGGLYHTRHKTKRSEWILEIANKLKIEGVNVKLYMFGVSKNIPFNIVDKYYCQPKIEKKNKLFNKFDIFIASSMLEGLHIVPQECMLTECCVVTTNAPLSGTQDYLLHKETGLISENNCFSLYRSVRQLVQDKSLRLSLGKNGRNKILDLGDRKTNMLKMIEILKTHV
jgi:glycosyltransferase involved in cell wall biosynthesis